MHKIEEVSKKEYEEVLKWLFGDKIEILSEYDETLNHDYYDPSIYYTSEIKEVFETEAMQRLSKIMHLGSTNIDKPHVYHNRLQHSKGAYRRCLEFIAFQYRKPEWKKYIEENGQKSYVVEKLKFMCVHDIGHSMLSHSIENVIGDKDCNHEIIGNEIILQNEEVSSILEKIKSDELESKPGDGSLEFYCEGNIDFDREDYMVRDCVYLGREYINDIVVNLNSMCNLKEIEVNGKKEMRYVYPLKALPYIEEFFEKRLELYKQEYRSKDRRMTDTLTSYLVKYITENELDTGKELKEYIFKFVNKSMDDIDVNQYIKGNDLVWLNSLIDMAENEKDKNLRDIALLCLPNTSGLINVAYSLTNKQKIKESNIDKDKNIEEGMTVEEKKLIKNLKKLIKCESELSPKLRTSRFKKNNQLSMDFEDMTEFENVKKYIGNILNFEETNGIECEKIKHKKYNIDEPIYIESSDGKTYTFDKLPERTMDISPEYVYYIYMIEPILKIDGISQKQIDEIRQELIKYNKEPKQNVFSERMNCLRLRIGKELVVPKGKLEGHESIKFNKCEGGLIEEK